MAYWVTALLCSPAAKLGVAHVGRGDDSEADCGRKADRVAGADLRREQAEGQCPERHQPDVDERVEPHHSAHQGLGCVGLDQPLVHVDEEPAGKAHQEREHQHLPELGGATGEERDRCTAHHRPLEDRSLVLHVALAEDYERRDGDADAHQRQRERGLAGVHVQFALHMGLNRDHDRRVDRHAGGQQQSEERLEVMVVEQVT